MAKARVLNLVATECDAAQDAAFNKWYNEVHVPMLFKYKGMKKVTRYKMMQEPGQPAKYLAVYEYDTKEELAALPQSAEFKAAIAEMEGTWKGKGFKVTWASNYEPIKTWER